MRALVTGGAGFVGTNLILRLLEDGYDVVSIDNYSTGFKKNEQAGCRYWDYDLSSETNPVLEMNEYDVIFHMAALARIQPSIKYPHKTILNNFVSTLNVLEAARKIILKLFMLVRVQDITVFSKVHMHGLNYQVNIYVNYIVMCMT